MTLAQFREHYLTRHTALAMRLTQGVRRYVVNLSAGDGEPSPPPGSPVPADAMTEIWTDAAGAFFTGASYASKEDAEVMTRDHMSFIGPMHAWLVEPEVKEEAPA